MARIEHSINIDGEVSRFGIDPVTKILDVPVNLDEHEFIQAIALEFSEVAPTEEDYPLDACICDENGLRHLNLASGWSISAADRAKLRRISPHSTH